MMNLCMFMSESAFIEDGFDSDCNSLMTLSETVDSAYALDLHLMCQAQLDNSALMTFVKQHILAMDKPTQSIITRV